jgi:hypothetical protein
MIISSDNGLFGGKELAAVGESVTAITLDSNVVIFVGQHREHEFRIENDIILTNYRNGPAIVVGYDPYSHGDPVREHLTELSSVVNTKLLHAKAFMEGILELNFDNGVVLSVQPLGKYEAWTYTFGNYILSCPPGGFTA